MVLQLAAPCALMPLLPVASTSKLPNAAPSPLRTARPAIQLKLTEDVLAKLATLAQAGQASNLLHLDLTSASPSFIVDGVPYPLNLSPEPPNTEIIRRNGKSRQLSAIATVSHKASVKPGAISKDAVERVGNSVRAHRELAEKERENRRTVLIDGAPPSRSSSHQRIPSGSSISSKRGISPAGSRGSSPAAPFHRAPSRLSAVPPKPTPASTARLPLPIKPPTSSFRIGKGAVPLSRSNSREKAEGDAAKSSEASPSGLSTGPAPSPSTSVSTPPSPDPTLTAASPNDKASIASPGAVSPEAIPPARQSSISSTSSNHDSSDSAKFKSSSTRTSLSSAASPPSVSALSATLSSLPEVAKSPTVKVTTTAPTSSPRVGGGAMKGKETLAKERRKEERAKDRKGPLSKATIDDSDDEVAAAETSASAKANGNPFSLPHVADPPALPAQTTRIGSLPSFRSSTSAAATTKRPSPSEPTEEAAKKKRKLLNNVAEETEYDRRSASPSTRGYHNQSRAPTPATAQKEDSKSKKRPRASSSQKKETTTWYTSSEDEDEDNASLPPPASRSKPTSSSSSSATTTPSTAAPPKRKNPPVVIKRARTSSVNSAGSEAEDPSFSSTSTVRGRPAVRAALPAHLQPGASSATRGVGSPLRGSSLAPPATPDVLSDASVSSSVKLKPGTKKERLKHEVVDVGNEVVSEEGYERVRREFGEAFGPYKALHQRLMREKEVLLSGSVQAKGKEELGVEELEKLVKRVEKQRAQLKGMQDALALYVAKVAV